MLAAYNSNYGSIRSTPHDDEQEREGVRGERATDPRRGSLRHFDYILVVVAIASTIVLLLSLFSVDNGALSRSSMLQQQNEKGILDLLRIRIGTTKDRTEAATTKEEGNDIIIKDITEIPFPHVDRAEFGSTPASDIVDLELFDESLRPSSSLSSSSNGLLNVPFPTGSFWTNLVLQKATSDQGLSYPVMCYPYGYKWSPDVLQISYPPLRRLIDSISIRDIFNPDLSFSSVEPVQSRKVMEFDPLSVTIRFNTGTADNNDDDNNNNNNNNNATGYWESYLVQGSPYVTLAYQQSTPVLTALSIFTSFTCPKLGSCKMSTMENDVDDSSETITLTGTHFQIRTQENILWILISSKPIAFKLDNIRKTAISAANEFSGVLRLVLLPPPKEIKPEYTSQFPTSFPSVDSKTAMQRLVCHANEYPVGGKVEWESGKKKNSASVKFKYETRTMAKRDLVGKGCPNNANELLMLALPHHVQVLPSNILLPPEKFDVTFRSIKGAMTPVLGQWAYDETLTTIGFESDDTLNNAGSLNGSVKAKILDQVEKDKGRVLPTLDENVYGFGKQIARLAQLAHIADVLEPDNESNNSLTSSIVNVCKELLASFLTGKNSDQLVFDVNFGGIVSKNGLRQSMDDFGNGWYNDHLFHYGYILYASAVLGKLDESFANEYGSAVDALWLDVVNPGTNFLPFTRHKSWYDGHSFASGLFPFADGKSMESSGESVNCYYGAYLWSTVRWGNQPERIDFARLLLAMEIRSVKTYWHMVRPDYKSDTYHVSDIYNPIFAKNLMVGNVGMNDVTVATWFGIEPLYVHMINFLPVTAITKELFEKSYVAEEFRNIIEPVYENVEMAWKGYVVCDKAMINPTDAWLNALELRSYELDSAISQSQVLYFASTMDEFENPIPSTAEISGEQQDASGRVADVSASCAQNNACAELGLTGLCCPSQSGVFLGCCDSSSNEVQKNDEVDTVPDEIATSSNTAATATPNSGASCAENEACANLGLLGLCCPSSNGVNLGCCGS